MSKCCFQTKRVYQTRRERERGEIEEGRQGPNSQSPTFDITKAFNFEGPTNPNKHQETTTPSLTHSYKPCLKTLFFSQVSSHSHLPQLTHTLFVFSVLPLSLSDPMASLSQTSTAFSASFKSTLARSSRVSSLKAVSFSITGKRFPSLTSRPGRFQVCCSAKPETLNKVCDIVKKQLALPDGTAVTAGSKFTELGADSLDTVEIVMGLEEEFGISVEEESAQTIATVQDAADLIEKLVEKKA